MHYIKINYFIMPYENYPIWPGTRSHVLKWVLHMPCVSKWNPRNCLTCPHGLYASEPSFSCSILIFLLLHSFGPRVSFTTILAILPLPLPSFQHHILCSFRCLDFKTFMMVNGCIWPFVRGESHFPIGS